MAWVASRADAFFEKAKEAYRPFHFTVGFHDPHRDDTREGFANDMPEVINAGLEGADIQPEDVEVQICTVVSSPGKGSENLDGPFQDKQSFT